MIFYFPFSDVNEALRWYFSRSWERPKNDAKTSWPNMEKVQSSHVIDDGEKVFSAFLKITFILDKILISRDIRILEEYYKRNGATQMEVAIEHNLTDRGIRYIRDRLIEKINDAFIKDKIVHLPKKEEIKYAQ